jgi:hypothetical protein
MRGNQQSAALLRVMKRRTPREELVTCHCTRAREDGRCDNGRCDNGVSRRRSEGAMGLEGAASRRGVVAAQCTCRACDRIWSRLDREGDASGGHHAAPGGWSSSTVGGRPGKQGYPPTTDAPQPRIQGPSGCAGRGKLRPLVGVGAAKVGTTVLQAQRYVREI